MNKVADIIKNYKINSMAMYRYIKTAEMIEHVTTCDNVKYIDDAGLEKVKNKFCNNKNEKSDNIDNESYNNVNKRYNSDISLLQLEITMLKQQSTTQNDYIETLKELLQQEKESRKDLTRLLENSQVLLKQQQEKIFLLEQPKDENNNAPDKVKSFWGKLNLFRRQN